MHLSLLPVLVPVIGSNRIQSLCHVLGDYPQRAILRPYQCEHHSRPSNFHLGTSILFQSVHSIPDHSISTARSAMYRDVVTYISQLTEDLNTGSPTTASSSASNKEAGQSHLEEALCPLACPLNSRKRYGKPCMIRGLRSSLNRMVTKVARKWKPKSSDRPGWTIVFGKKS